jgi:hypothetical protein
VYPTPPNTFLGTINIDEAIAVFLINFLLDLLVDAII